LAGLAVVQGIGRDWFKSLFHSEKRIEFLFVLSEFKGDFHSILPSARRFAAKRLFAAKALAPRWLAIFLKEKRCRKKIDK